ncbi:MAG: hypothetical protein ACK4RK_07060 [Gemmataceae bacterium]
MWSSRPFGMVVCGSLSWRVLVAILVIGMHGWRQTLPFSRADDALPEGVRRQLGTAENKAGVTTLAFAPNGQLLATGGWDGVIRVWNVTTGELQGTLHGHKGDVYSVAFSPDGKTLASGGKDRRIRFWDVRKEQEIPSPSFLNEHTGSVMSLAFAQDGRMLVSGSDDRTIRVWQVASGSYVPLEIQMHQVLSVAASADGTVLASGGRDGAARLWDAITGRQRHYIGSFSSFVSMVSFTPDGKYLIVAGGGTAPSHSFCQYHMHETEPNAIPMDKVSGNVLLVETATGTVVTHLPVPQQSIHSLTPAPQGYLLALTGDSVSTISLWSWLSGQEIRQLKGQKGNVLSLAFSPDGKTLASGSEDGTVFLWDVSDCQPLNAAPPPAYSDEQLEQLWTELAAHPCVAHQAKIQLLRAPDQAIVLLQKKLTPVAGPEFRALAQLLADLDSEHFETRQAAYEKLEQLGVMAERALRQALPNTESLEARRALRRLLETLEQRQQRLPADELRFSRAIQVLELSATPSARQVLQALSQGAALAPVTLDAQAALRRLDRRAAK